MNTRFLGLAAIGLCLGVVSVGCSMPSALAPSLRGSIGLPHSGFLTDSAELPAEGKGFKWRRPSDHHWGVPRMIALLEEAAGRVAIARPGSQPVVVGELSARGGGALMPTHRSHRTGRDVDVLFFVTSVEGVAIPNPDFVKIGPDGLGVSSVGRFIRFDTARQQRRTHRRGAAVLPDDGVGNRHAGFAVPHHSRFALVGNTDRIDVGSGDAAVAQRVLRACELRGPDFIGIVFDPTRLRKNLAELASRGRHRLARMVEHDRPRTCGALIEREDVSTHRIAGTHQGNCAAL